MKSKHVLWMAVVALLMASCQEFFSTSLASWAARPAPPIPENLTTQQALDYAAQATSNNDIELAKALTPKLLEQAKTTTDQAEYNQLAGALLNTVLTASNTGGALNTALSELPNLQAATDDPEALLAAVENITSALDAVSFSETDLEALQQIADRPPDNISSDDLFIAAASLLYQSGEIDDLSSGSPEDVLANAETSTNPMTILALELYNLIPEDDPSSFTQLLEAGGL